MRAKLLLDVVVDDGRTEVKESVVVGRNSPLKEAGNCSRRDRIRASEILMSCLYAVQEQGNSFSLFKSYSCKSCSLLSTNTTVKESQSLRCDPLGK